MRELMGDGDEEQEMMEVQKPHRWSRGAVDFVSATMTASIKELDEVSQMA